jgi:hypothetical protein
MKPDHISPSLRESNHPALLEFARQLRDRDAASLAFAETPSQEPCSDFDWVSLSLWGGYVLFYFISLGALSVGVGTALFPTEPDLAREAGFAVSPFLGIALASLMLGLQPEQGD